MGTADSELPGRMLDAWNRRDLETMISLADPEIEYVNAPSSVEPGTRRGVDEVAEVMREQWDVLADARQDIDRVYERGGEIFTAGRVSRSMPGSEARLENRLLISWRVRDGKVTRLAVLGGGSDFQAALEDAGLTD
jgi:ketosteroid isomerase-like protein